MASTSNSVRSTPKGDRMNLEELCFHLRKRRGMYLSDDRYSTAVSFIEGFNVALDGEPLRGFQPWLASRIRGGESSIHWAYLVAAARMPQILEGNLRLDRIPPECDNLLIDDLLQLIDEFITSSTS